MNQCRMQQEAKREHFCLGGPLLHPNIPYSHFISLNNLF
jgi:hypothetical protein